MAFDWNAIVEKWFGEDGDNTYRIDYPELTEKSTVYDIGGYQGGWAKKIYEKYSCNVKVYEPVPVFYNQIQALFSNNNKIKVFNYGLAEKTHDATINVLNDASSVYIPGSNKQTIALKDVVDEIGDEIIDLMKINIEGGEFPLLERLIDSEKVKQIKNLQIQFHLFYPDAQNKRDELLNKLSLTHSCMWDFPFVWEGWKIK